MGDNVKQDLYSHLVEVFTRIMQYHPYDGFDKFEEISVLVKKTHMKTMDPKFDYELNNNIPLTNREALVYIEKAKSLLKEETTKRIAVEDKQFVEKDKSYVMPNLMEQAKMFDWAGINFGDDTVYLIQKSLKKLALTSSASPIRFFGKIYGT